MSGFKTKKGFEKTDAYIPSCLILPDIEGWAIDNIACNLIRVMNGKDFRFTKKFTENENLLELEQTYQNYDVVYIMLPSYLPKVVMGDTNIITTFNGGPGCEGQADAIDRAGLNNMRISYPCTQVFERMTTYEWKSNRRVQAPMTLAVDEQKLLQEQRLTGADVVKYRVDNEFPPEDTRKKVNLHIWRHGFGLTNLHLTPYGINSNEYKSDVKINQKEFNCGYAGWAKYITGNQQEHRRINWIFEAQDELHFDIHFAGGLRKYAGKDIDFIKKRYGPNPQIHIDSYSKEEIHKFYTKINCYLVPDKFAGGPLPVMEAGLFGIPPVTTKCGICGDFIKHMETGYVVDTKEHFFEGIRFMRDNPEKRIEMGQNLRKYLLKHRSWEVLTPNWKNFLGG